MSRSCSRNSSTRRVGRAAALALAGLVCAALFGTVVSPVWARDGGEDGDGSVVVGGFALGDGLEGTVTERDGSFQVAVPVTGVPLRWDSRGLGSDRMGLGHAWDLGLEHIESTGGIRVIGIAGGVHAPDPTHPSGLAGYGLQDVIFEQRAGVLEARAASSPGLEYAYVVHELGGGTAYFTAAGDPAARVDVHGLRTDWVWDSLVPHRLIGVMNPDGVVSRLDWESEPGTVLVRRSTSLEPSDGPEETDEPWRIEFDGGRVVGVTDPLGGRIAFGYDELGLLTSLTTPTGAATEIAWTAGADGSARVHRVRTVDQAGVEMSARSWASAGDGMLSSGWPVFRGEGDVFWSGDPAFRYSTVLSDGATRVETEYNSLHVPVRQRTIGTTEQGELVLREQTFEYAGTAGGEFPDPAALEGNWARPERTDLNFRDAHGGLRTQTETSTTDARGRVVEQHAVDGTVTTTEYDEEVPDGRRLPVGLPLVERVVAPDGHTSTTVHTLNSDRTAAIATTVSVRRPGDAPSDDTGSLEHVTQFREFEVDARGRVVEERRYPDGDRSATPVVSRWTEVIDLGAATKTCTETLGAGAPEEVSTTEVTSLLHDEVVETGDELGNVTRVELDALGRAVRAVDAAGRVTTTTYEAAPIDGRTAVTRTTPDGVSTTEVRDVLGRSIQVIDNIRDGEAVPGHARNVETTAYPAPGVEVVTDAWGAVTVTRTDVFGRPVRKVRPTGLVEVVEYDEVANTVTSALTPTGRLADAELVVTKTLDAAGQEVEERTARADGMPARSVRTEYDGFGRETGTSTEALATRIEHDLAGNPISTRHQPAPGVDGSEAILEERRFDGLGNTLAKVVSDGTAARSGVVRTLDALGRTVSELDQAGRRTSIAYTRDGLTERIEAGTGQVTEHTYDPVSRTLVGTLVTSPIGPPVRTSTAYDPATDRPIAVWDPEDREATEIRTTWDAHGNPTRVAYPDGRTVAHRYDAHGRRTHTIDIAGTETDFEYHASGRLVGAVQRDARGDVLAEVAYEFDRFDRLVALRRGNGVTTRYTYTSASEIASEQTTHDGVMQCDRAYIYDGGGNLTQRRDTTHQRELERDDTTVTDYAYDAYDRLIRSTEHRDTADGPVARDTRYVLGVSDDILRETTMTDPGTPRELTRTRDFAYDPLGQLTVVDHGPEHGGVQVQTYDDAGNLLRAVDGTEYAYDAANRQITQTGADGRTVRTRYWADGRRGERESIDGGDVSTTRFYWSDDTLLNDAHAGAAGGGVAAYLVGQSRQARTVLGADAASTTYFGTDRHANVTDLTDGAGAVVATYAYTDYGVQLRGDGETGLRRNPFGFAGEYTDEIGTQHLAVRSYHPGTMRFTTMDIADLHNRYNFGDLNPITNVDPSGRAPQPDQWGPVAHLIFLAMDLFCLVAGIAVGVGAIYSMVSLVRVATTTAARLALGAQMMSDGVGHVAIGGLVVPEVAQTISIGAGAYLTTAAAAGTNFGSSAISAVRLWDTFVDEVLPDRVSERLLLAESVLLMSGARLAKGVFEQTYRVVSRIGLDTTEVLGDARRVRRIRDVPTPGVRAVRPDTRTPALLNEQGVTRQQQLERAEQAALEREAWFEQQRRTTGRTGSDVELTDLRQRRGRTADEF